MSVKNYNFEEAVRHFRHIPGNEENIRLNYFDLPVAQAAERYSRSEEFQEISALLGPGNGRRILDLGAGHGIASYAFARNGWKVTAVEPDPSTEVGAGAIRQLAADTGLEIEVIESWGEDLPFPDGYFHAAYARQVLHHARDLNQMLLNLARVVGSEGVVLTVRDHVVDNEEQLQQFLAAHPLHVLHGSENAFPLETYKNAFRQAGLQIMHEFGPTASILNYYPGTKKEMNRLHYEIACSRWKGLGRLFAWSPAFRRSQLRNAAQWCNAPGRLYSFFARKHA